MDFPFDLSIIWLSLFLSMIFIVAFVFRCSYFPTLKKQKSFLQLNEELVISELPVHFISERLYIVFRKIPTKELGSNSIEEERFLSFSKIVRLYLRGGIFQWKPNTDCSQQKKLVSFLF